MGSACAVARGGMRRATPSRQALPRGGGARRTAAASATKLVETRYDVSGYVEPASSALRHEAHAVYRRTRVPIAVIEDPASVPRTTYPPASFAPLPASDELAAELATQKAITVYLRSLQVSMAEAEQRAQAQYAMLVRQSAEAMKVREQLEAERVRVRNGSTAGVTAPPANATGGHSGEVKW